jgi:Relaxase/Mobilisation nuclease domain
MIVRILSHGSSFQGLATYLTRDAEAETSDRVGWTHTLNCANDHVPAAVNEMLWTARDAELLKQEAGVRAGGRQTEKTVKHLSLNWAPDERPTQAHMIATTEDFLRHMQWNEHQAVLVAHTDKAYAHVHVMLNVIHPETGLALDDDFERRSAQAWAENYEREHGGIRCENRLHNIGEREPAPTRPAWQAFQGVRHDFEKQEQHRAATAERGNDDPSPEVRGPAREWEILKNMQREERLDFFADGKQAFAEMRGAVFREVREEFRPHWAEYYAASKNGADLEALKELKATLVNEQRTMLEERRDEAYAGLRQSREALYQDLLAGQRDQRRSLTDRQAIQLDSLDLMQSFSTDIPRDRVDIGRGNEPDPWSQAAKAAVSRDDNETGASDPHGRANGERSAGAVGMRAADGVATGILSFFDFAASTFSRPAPRPTSPTLDELFAKAAAARFSELRDQARAPTHDEEEERHARQSESSQQ